MPRPREGSLRIGRQLESAQFANSISLRHIDISTWYLPQETRFAVTSGKAPYRDTLWFLAPAVLGPGLGHLTVAPCLRPVWRWRGPGRML
jgi:hypothetical protein